MTPSNMWCSVSLATFFAENIFAQSTDTVTKVQKRFGKKRIMPKKSIIRYVIILGNVVLKIRKSWSSLLFSDNIVSRIRVFEYHSNILFHFHPL